MNEDNIYDQLKKMLAKTGGKYNIMEEKIDVELQVEFFELVNKLIKEKRNPEDVIADEKKLYDHDVDDVEKKKILAELSNTESVEAYRIIERFIDTKDINLNTWAVLALQHARISLETHLLDEQQIFISTGLGGKGDKLRYFFVCKVKDDLTMTDVQKKVAQTEFEIIFDNHNSIIEEIKFQDKYFSVLSLIPINISVNDIIKLAIDESNQYGDFLNDKYLVTNVKVLEKDEIEQYFKKMKI